MIINVGISRMKEVWFDIISGLTVYADLDYRVSLINLLNIQ